MRHLELIPRRHVGPALLVALALAFPLAGGAFALPVTVIDDFTSGDYFESLTGGTGDMFSRADAGTMIGGQRDSMGEVEVDATPPGPPPAFNVFIGAGLLDVTSTSFVDGILMLTYDAAGAGLNADLSNAVSIDVDFLAADLNIPLTVELTDGALMTADSTQNTLSGAQTLSFPIGAFAGLNLADIDEIKFTFDPPQAGDFTATVLGITTETVVIPEPGTVGLGLFAILGAALWCTWRKFGEQS